MQTTVPTFVHRIIGASSGLLDLFVFSKLQQVGKKTGKNAVSGSKECRGELFSFYHNILYSFLKRLPVKHHGPSSLLGVIGS